MSKPSIILIPGSFSLPSFYDNVVNPVAAAGYPIRALHYPSVGLSSGQSRPGVPATMYDDAAFIAAETRKLVDEGRDVILIPHSYGGVPTTESLKGLSKLEREMEGKSGGVVRIAYITCLVPPIGTPAGMILSVLPAEQQLKLEVDEQGWMHQDPVKAAPIVFSDLSKEEGEAMIGLFPNHSAISFAGELTHAGYKDVPVSYLLCEEDLTIPPKIQREGIELIEKVSEKKVDVTSIKAGHCPTVTQPDVVVEWILDLAGKA